jgi:4,5-DOPA dioxygenase extradiol
MKRRSFLKVAGVATGGWVTGMGWNHAMGLNELKRLESVLPVTPRMPALFLGHGSPMNAIEDNEFVEGFRRMGASLPLDPAVVLCVSAHWETIGTKVTAMDLPETIHDFGGFPQALYDVQYPAQGHPRFAAALAQDILSHHIETDHTWGLDHGTWSVIKHLYPKANIPVVQLSLDRTSSPEAHWELGRQLGRLRERGVLIVGSGNVVHNLGKVAWSRMHEVDYSYDWARDAADVIRGAILRGDDKALCEAPLSNRAALKLAIPTFEHYLPLLYVMGARTSEESLQVFNDHAVAGSLYMTSVALGVEG